MAGKPKIIRKILPFFMLVASVIAAITLPNILDHHNPSPAQPIPPETTYEEVETTVEVTELSKKLNSPNFLNKSWNYYANIISQLKQLPKSQQKAEMLNHAVLLQQIVRLRGHFLSVEKPITLDIYKKELGKPELTSTGLEQMLPRRIKDLCKPPLTPEQQDILQLWLENPK